MKVKYKSLIIVIVSVTVLISVTSLIFYLTYFGYINSHENDEMKRSFKNIGHIVQNEEENLSATLIDWAHWDATYEFMGDLNIEYIQSNLQDNTMNTLNLVSMYFINGKGEIIYTKEYGLEYEIALKITEKVKVEKEKLKRSSPLIRESQNNIGLFMINGKAFMIAIAEVVKSNEQGEANGALVFVRSVEGALLNYMNDVVNAEVTFSEFSPEAFKDLVIEDSSIKTEAVNKVVQGNKKVKDIDGNDSIVISIYKPIEQYYYIFYYLKIFAVCFLSLIITIIIIVVGLMNKFILKRLHKYHSFIENVASTKDVTCAVDMGGSDEFTELGNATNRMLSQLDSAYKEILLLSYSDKLTGLKNRAFMENCFEELDCKKESSYFIIMGDLNGLKAVNDRFGHKSGNNLLVIIGNIFKKSCDEDDIIARWGGDEFVVLVTNKPRKYVEKLVDSIKYECLQINNFESEVSMAIGYAEKSTEFKDTDAVMSLAEKRMYRNKLMENSSSRNATISSLRRTLHEKHSETEEHTLRIKNLGVKLGQRLGLSQDKLDELELLAMLHDIGKVGIPEHILMKPGKLTNEEWVIMKTHTEIGYRIARSTPELSHIAEAILYHHERYDGTGYPEGIKGEEIPILSRIINIVDSYDVMTHRRIYKDSFSVDFAFEEIKKCSGTQFDPYIAQEFMDMFKEDIEA
jgi:diguanylate cyclase (GGDEF)-like protein